MNHISNYKETRAYKQTELPRNPKDEHSVSQQDPETRWTGPRARLERLERRGHRRQRRHRLGDGRRPPPGHWEDRGSAVGWLRWGGLRFLGFQRFSLGVGIGVLGVFRVFGGFGVVFFSKRL